MSDLVEKITACRLCAPEFAATATAHDPRPVAWFAPGARILVAGQAPGLRVHETGLPFNDPSGDRLRAWMGIGRETFYDRSCLAIVPMAFCFPGYDAKGSDLPPPKRCSATWHAQVMAALPDIRLTILVGGYAHRWHLGTRAGVTETVAGWRAHAPRVFPLPHPSWRNTGWRKKNPWFEEETVPALKDAIKEALDA
ncbi:uracil-DNA glycosylase family protein [Marimonas lutisalis]|uniref:uracil-DNA glycosylase family protein n=1 Tax=Marimonas lutisalis TaxID=2545756 RepID=UPI0010F81AB9|nr:uracil-DNA glycosylase family protein [Marimonas lutisalis]